MSSRRSVPKRKTKAETVQSWPLQITLSTKQRDLLNRAAERHGLSAAAYVRSVLLPILERVESEWIRCSSRYVVEEVLDNTK